MRHHSEDLDEPNKIFVSISLVRVNSSEGEGYNLLTYRIWHVLKSIPRCINTEFSCFYSRLISQTLTAPASLAYSVNDNDFD